MLDNTLEVFTKNTALTLKSTDLMIISVMVDNTFIESKPFGFVFELLG